MYRIAVSGAHGVGKTTLATSLAEELGLPLIGEVAREVARDFGFKTTGEIVASNPGKKTLYQINVFYAQIKAEKGRRRGFVSDRSVFDSLAYSLFYGLHSTVGYLLDEALAHSKNYSLIVYCPIPTPDGPADDGFRLTDRASQQRVDEYLSQLLEWAECPVLRLTADRGTWLEQVLEYLGRVSSLPAGEGVCL